MGIGEEQIDKDTRPSSNGDKFGRWSTGALDSATKINLIVTDIQNESLSIHIFFPGEYRLLASLNSIIHDFTPRVENSGQSRFENSRGKKLNRMQQIKTAGHACRACSTDEKQHTAADSVVN